MKIEKLVSITVLNSFLLLVFGAIMASCQKSEFQKNGLLSKWEVTEASRSIASVIETDSEKTADIENFIKYQDPKQILLFCEINSNRPSACYNDKISKVFNRFTKHHGNKRSLDISYLKNHFNYENTYSRFSKIITSINLELNPEMKKLSSYREKFCLKNSKVFLDKCLTQYIEKDTFSVLNKFHTKNKMNGHEYIYFKGHIRKQLESKLQEAKLNIETKNSTI